MMFWSAALDDPLKQVPLSEESRESTGWWLQEERWASGIPRQVPNPLYTDVLMIG